MQVRRVVRVAARYSALVFGIGFVLGTVRVIFVAPRLGEGAAELIETPPMVFVSWLVGRWITRRYTGIRRPASSLAVGAFALAFLLMLEVAIGSILFGLSLGSALIKPDPVRTATYYTGLALFAGMPLLLSRPSHPCTSNA
jgi:hypothetical protein